MEQASRNSLIGKSHLPSTDRWWKRGKYLQREKPEQVNAVEPRLPSVRRQGFWSITTQSIILGCGVVSAVVVNRLLMPEGRGQAAAIMLWPPLLATLAAAGWANANTWYVSKNPCKSRAVWSSTMIAGVVLSAVMIPIGYVLLPLLLYRYPDTWSSARLFLLAIPMHITMMATTSVLEGLGQFGRSLWIRAGLAGLSLLLVLSYPWSSTLSAASYSILVLVANAIITIGSLALLAVSTIGSWRPEWSARPGFALKTAPQVWAYALYERFDLILLTSFLCLDKASFGVFVAATSVARLLSPVTTGVAMVLLPASASRSPVQSMYLFRKAACVFTVAALLGMAPLVYFASDFLALAFGDGYAAGAIFLQLGLIHGLFAGILAFGNSTLQGMGEPEKATLVRLVSVAIALFVAVSLLPSLAASGVLLGKAIGALLGILLLFRTLKVTHHVPKSCPSCI